MIVRGAAQTPEPDATLPQQPPQQPALTGWSGARNATTRALRLAKFLPGYLRATWLGMEIAEGPAAKLRVLALKGRGFFSGRNRGADAPPIPIRIKELGGRELHLRPGTPDLVTAVDDYIYGIHLPPPQIDRQGVDRIVELGSNTGSALASFAVRYPNAQLLGVEPDRRNLELAKRNVAQFGERCQTVHAGIWDTETELAVVGDHPSGYALRPSRPSDPQALPRVAATTVQSLLERFMPEGDIDYLYMTVEGAEARVLEAAEPWIGRVRSIRLDWGIGGDPCLEQLRSFGFDAWIEAEGAGTWTLGVRPQDRAPLWMPPRGRLATRAASPSGPGTRRRSGSPAGGGPRAA